MKNIWEIVLNSFFPVYGLPMTNIFQLSFLDVSMKKLLN